ncbi:MCE family protein [Nocardioides nanhaiensis]|uniref:MCE family protein n=1 Tax=Nocardioides nanhaiensis TaxID=1476871 RepID=A0ABP8WII0_9ACTN
MLVNIHHDSKREHVRLLLAGVVFLTAIAVLIGLSIGVYNKTFARVTMITVKADRAGLQLAKFGDVRLNGVLVGEVRDIDQDGQEASIRVALQPGTAEQIPENAGVQILPTTLFGQKYLSFVMPPARGADSLREGSVIPSSRVEVNVELSRILAELFPLLRAVRPADLNMTLNALATALEGRGEQLGQTLEDLDAYLGDITDLLPTLREDLVLLAEVADSYDVAAPDLLATLDNLTVTAKTVTQKRREIGVFFSDVSGLARTSTRVLADNEANLVRVGEVTAPVLDLLATYSPQFPCLVRGAAKYKPLLAKTFAGNEIRQYVEVFTPQYRAYGPQDIPVYGEVGRGPWCAGLPNPAVPAGPNAFDDGTDLDDNPPTSIIPGAPQRVAPSYPAANAARTMSSGLAGTPGDQAVVNAVLAGRSGGDADTYGSLGSLLYGPVVRGGR